MKKKYSLIQNIFILLTLSFLTNNAIAQCPAPNNNFLHFGAPNMTPTGIGDTVRSTSFWGGDFTIVDVDSGKTYHMSTCETTVGPRSSYTIGGDGITYSPLITLYEDTGNVGDFNASIKRTVGSARRNCPTVNAHPVHGAGGNVMAEITYTADFTGRLAVALDPWDTFLDSLDSFGNHICDSFAVDSSIMYITQIPSGPSISFNKTDISTNGGSDGVARAVVTGGTLPYTYLWSTGATVDSITGLAAGTYTLTVTDSDPGGAKMAVNSTTFIDPPVPPVVAEYPDSFEYQMITNPAGLDTASVPVLTQRLMCPKWGDLDGDGDMDFVTGSRHGKLFYYENTGTISDPLWVRTAHATIDTISILPAASGGTNNEVRVELVDIDADGDLDLFVSARFNYIGNKLDDINFYRNIGSSSNAVYSFEDTGIPGINFQQMGEFANFDFADLDFDGDLDMISMGSDTIAYMENVGTVTSPSFARRTGSNNPFDAFTDPNGLVSSPNMIDYDKDGDLDLFYSNDAGFIRFIENVGTASSPDFTPFLNLPVSPVLDTLDFGNFISADFQDATGDGVLDLIVGSFNPVPGLTSTFAWVKGITLGPKVSFASSNISCNGLIDGSATATATGIAPFFYQWSTGDTLTTSGTSMISSLAAGTYTVTVTENGGTTITDMITITEPTALTVSNTPMDLSCNGAGDGNITATPTGGTSPYTYMWSNAATTATASALAAGTYTATVTDANGCTATSSGVINEPAALVASTTLDANDSGGSNGAATANATGGTSPYTYNWSNTATTASTTNLSSGTYSVTITDNNGCTDSASIFIAAGPSVSATTDSTVSCHGFSDGGATASVSGGTMPFTYAWSNTATTASITGVAAGIYTVTVTDNNGLTASNSATISQPTALAATSTVSSHVSCNGGANGAITNNGAGGTGIYTYTWSNGSTTANVSSLSAGTYTVTITDANGCTVTNSETVTEPTAIVAAIALDSNDMGNGGGATASATGGTSPYTYNWSNSATSATIVAVMAGTYTVTITDNNGCTDDDMITITAGPVISMQVDSNVTCNGLTDGGATANVSAGNPPYTYAWSNSATTASITGVAAGTYSITVTDNIGLSETDMITITEPNVLVAANVVDSNLTCKNENNGGATASATGGTMPYTYNWSNSATTASITGVAAGTYTVTVTDANGCSSSSSSTITEPDSVQLSIPLVVDASCNGFADGGFIYEVTGGTPTISGTDTTYFFGSSLGVGPGLNRDSVSGFPAGSHFILAADANNCVSDTTFFTITEPTVLVAASVIDSNVSCNGFTDGGATSSASGGIAPYTYAWSNSATSASITGVAAGTYTVTVTDNNGCTDVTSSSITEPTTLIASTVLDSNASCAGQFDGGGTASATGGTMPYTYVWSNSATTASITGVTNGTYYITVTDANACIATDSVVVGVLDLTKPTVITQNISLYLDANGMASITAADVNNGSNDACGIATTVIDSSNFDCSEVGANTVVLTVTDVSSNSDTAHAIVTVLDTVKPTVTTQNVTVYLDANGMASITTADINNGSTDNCSIMNMSLDSMNFDCSEVGANTVTLTVNDVNSNSNSTTAIVTVLDTIKPTVITQNISLYLDANGQASITTADINNGSSDNCSIQVMSLDSMNFDCSEVGANTVTLTVTDVNTNVESATATVTVIDSIKPTVITQNINLYLDANGTASITTADINNGSSDNCSIMTMSLDSLNFDCSEVGANTVNLTITDVNSNVASASATVTVIDSLNPIVVTQNVTVYLDANGQASITTADVNNGSSDNCSIMNMSLDSMNFDCSEVGANTVTLTISDVNSNVDSVTAVVTVVDSINPTVITQNVTVYLDANGAASITTADINNGSSDNCSIMTMALDSMNFDCSEVGANTVTLTVTDVNSNVDSTTATVTVLDTLNPIVITQNVTLYLDANGQASITTGDINNGSSDNCSIMIMSLDSMNFDCSEVGTNTVTLTITDVNNNVDSATAVVTVVDSINPTIITQNITVYLDANGVASITTADINNGSSDNCNIMTMSLDSMNFDCSEVGTNTVTLTVTDVNSNVDSATAIVTVLDTLNPIVITQDVTVYLDANGQASITTGDINNGSSDNCSIMNMSLDSTTFDCSEVGANTVTLTVTDVNSNVEAATAVVTVLDTLNPIVITQNVTVYLDASGAASISTTDIDSGSSDNCSIANISLDSANFDCTEEGTNTVTLYVTDVNNNVDSATATVTVLDTINPLISGCPANISQTIDFGNCTAVVTWMAPTAADNCTVDSLVASHNSGDVFALGTTTVTYVAYDPELNTDTCTFTVTITDSEDPVIANVPANITVSNDNGVCGAVVTWTSATATDNCTLDSLRSDFNSGDQFPEGTTTVTYTAYDASMNTSTASFTVTVNDTELPTIVCPSNINQCDSFVSWTSPVGLDNCANPVTIRNDATGLNSGDEFPIGISTISYEVTDASNNQATCSFEIEVYAPPIANAGLDLTTRDIEPVQIMASSTNAASFRWTPAFSIAIDTVEQPIANPQTTTTYTMEVTSPDGCTDTDDMEINVKVVTKLNATTLFSPNGDGMNDTWVVNKPELIKGCQLIIVNRNGTEVYSTSQYNNEWDGTVGGSELPEGTYYYVFDCPDGRSLNGPITILRERR